MKLLLFLLLVITGSHQPALGFTIASYIQAQVFQLETANIGANTFRRKYKCFPGDCAHITEYFASSHYPELCDGNGDGVLQQTPDCDETSQYWAHLQAAELLPQMECLVEREGTCVVIRARLEHEDVAFLERWFGDERYDEPLGLVALSDGKGNYFQLARSSDDGTRVRPGLTPQEAYDLDSKLDDGRPGTGAVVARSTQEEGSAFNAPLKASDAGFKRNNPRACLSEAASGEELTSGEVRSAEYALLNESLACSLRFKMN